MDQISLQKKSVGTESTETSKFSIYEPPGDKWINVAYSDRDKYYAEGKMMSFKDSLSYLATSERRNILVNSPDTAIDLNHMAKVMNVDKHKKVHICLQRGEVNGMTAPFLKMGIENCIGKEKNNITVRYLRKTCTDDDDNYELDILKIENKAIKFSLAIGFHNNPIFPHLVDSLKLLKNTNQFVHLYLHADIKTLFESMKWTFGKKMVNWMKMNTKTEYKMIEDNSKTMDSNEYKIMYKDYEGERESDCESEISDDEISWEENKNVDDVAPKRTLKVAELFHPDTGRTAIHVFYYEPNDSLKKYQVLTSDAVLEYISKSELKNIATEGLETSGDLEHIEKIMKIRGDKAITFGLPKFDGTGINEVIRKFVMEKCVEKQEKNIFISFDRAREERVSGIVDTIYIKSEVNKVSCEIYLHPKSAFPLFVKCIQDIRNHNCEVDIEMKTHFKLLFKAMNWNFDSDMAEWLKKYTKLHGWIPEGPEDVIADSNTYSIYHNEYDEDAECDCEMCSHDQDSSEKETDEYCSDVKINATSDDLDKINLKDYQSSPGNRKIVSEYLWNVPPAKLASTYFNEVSLEKEWVVAVMGPL